MTGRPLGNVSVDASFEGNYFWFRFSWLAELVAGTASATQNMHAMKYPLALKY